MKPIIVILCFLLFLSCNTEQKSRHRIELLQKSKSAEKYELGISCMQYISQKGSDFKYSKGLVKKLLDMGFFMESIYAVEMLQANFPKDPELYYLKGLGYHNLLQYSLAVENFNRALKMQPDNKVFLNAANSISGEEKIWNEIQILDDSLADKNDIFAVLLDRAEKLFAIRQYDAVLYDLGSISKMGSTRDSLYFTNSVSSIYQGGGRKSVETLNNMIRYFQTTEDKKNSSNK